MPEQVVFDIGFHRGEDTRCYLAGGFRVVAAEANPLLAAEGRKRFSEEIAAGRLVLLNVGVVEHASVQSFWINHSRSEWSSFNASMGCRGEKGGHSVEVECVMFEKLLEAYGVPHYLKIDIEGNDIFCIRGIAPSSLPRYLSCEASDPELLELLREKGYTKFKMINQFDGFRAFDRARELSVSGSWQKTLRWNLSRLTGRAARFPAGGSGPFGEEADGAWLAFDVVAAHYRSFYTPEGKPLNDRSWFDFHATFDA